MKIYMAGTVIDLKDMSEQDLQTLLQDRYDDWLGKGTVKVEIPHLEHKVVEMRLYRKYGSFYQNPQSFSGNIGSIFQLDKNIILGVEYQTGTYAVLTQLIGRYVIREDIGSIFLPEWKELEKDNHCSRIKKIDFTDYLDHFDLRVELV